MVDGTGDRGRRVRWEEYWNDRGMLSGQDYFKQVGRTFHGANYSEREMCVLVTRILTFLEASREKTLLELACGNGMLTSRIAPYFKHVTAVDFSVPLIEVARTQFACGNVEYAVGDARHLNVVGARFDCALIYFAFQYFTPSDARKVFRRLAGLVKPGGRVLLGDVADRDRIWNFYRGLTGRLKYARDEIRGQPIIGYWWRPSELLKAATELQWKLSVHYQHAEMPNHYFRYDAVLETGQ